MKTFRLSSILIAFCALLIGGLPLATPGTTASAPTADDMTTPTRQELARARAATARYHDVAQAEADGYININFCEPGEGCHWLKPSLLDATFDPEQPEILLYAPTPGENRLRLVAVEYLVPLAFSPGTPPAGFTGDADPWREDSEGAGFWETSAWLWFYNPTGIFEQYNPRVP